MEVRLYQFGKKPNSTAVPSGAGTVYNMQLKDNCSIITPVLQFHEPVGGYNYCYIPAFSRYYFISNCSYILGQWEISCIVDVLGSFRSSILASTQYVLRSASESNGAVVDAMYPVTADTNKSVAVNSTGFYTMAGAFCVGVAGTGSALGCAYYLMTPSNFASFISSLLSNAMIDGNPFVMSNADGDTTLGDGIIKALVNPLQYIKSCFFLPVDQSALMQLGTAQTGIQIGAWKVLNVSCRVLGSVATYVSPFRNITVPKHPQATRGIYLNGAPYSNYRFLMEPFGMFELPATDLCQVETIACRIALDIVTGQCDLDIYGDNSGIPHNYLVAHKVAQLGIPIAITQITENALTGIASGLTHGISAATNLAAGNLVGVAGNITAAVMDGINSIMPTVTSSGSSGSFLCMGHAPQLIARFSNVAPEDNAHNGRPLCADRVLNTLSGYCVTDKPTIQINYAMKDEVTKIENLMQAGFFIE